jgi:bifunctional ADP-heptose synthase (sugar kinase/adenylyltransferase)
MKDLARLNDITRQYDQLTIAIVGDFCLDRYLEIDPALAEISLETGLPVHNVVRVRSQPGAAGTVLNNLAALGVGRLIPIGWCGDDGEGYELRRALSQVPGVTLDAFVTEPSRRTFTYCKPLLMHPGSPPEELNRLDSKNRLPTPSSLQEQLCQSLRKIAEKLDAIVVMDQTPTAETGTVTQQVKSCVMELAERFPKLTMIAWLGRLAHSRL